MKGLSMVREAELHEIQLPDPLDGERVDRVVSLAADVSRKEAAELIVSGAVLVNGDAPAKASLRLRTGDRLRVAVPFRDDTIVDDPTVDVHIHYLDDEVIVVDKQAGMIVHPGAGATMGTLIQGLLAQFPEIASVGSDATRPGVVHRLDKGTSGLLMVARTQASLESLSGQLAERTVTRRYQALAWGTVQASHGIVDAPLGRSPNDATRQAVVAEGREARTGYEVITRYEDPPMSFLHCQLETGRTHQIRVHLDAIGNPIVGDDRYGGGSRDRMGLTRPFLHAGLLGFVHPKSNEYIEFETEMPDDLQDLLAQLAGSVVT